MNNPSKTVTKAIDILEVFLRSDATLNITEVSRLTGLNTATAYRLVSTLIERGYLSHNQRKGIYTLGLKLLDYNYRFPMITSPFDSTNHAALLYTLGYEWTGRRDYLRVVNQLVQEGLAVERTPVGPHTRAHPTMGVPAALTKLGKAEDPIAPYPLLEFKQDADPTPIVFERMTG